MVDENNKDNPDYKLGAKVGLELIDQIESLFHSYEKISKSNGKLVWSTHNPFAASLQKIDSHFHKKEQALIDRLDHLKGSHDQNMFTAGMMDKINSTINTDSGKVNMGEVVQRLDENFQKYYVDKSPYKKNLQVPAGVKTQSELFTHLLQNNRGVALGDVHTLSNSTDFLTKNMKAAKAAGVDTIYTDTVTPDELDYFNSKSVGELKEEMSKADWKSNKKDRAQLLNVKEACDSKDIYNMFIAAKENGIAITKIENRLLGKEVITQSEDLRVATTNYEWTQNIEADRKGKTGKFILFAGEAHLANIQGNSKGLVDDALGIPNMELVSSKKDDGKYKQGGFEGVDFALDAGPKYKVLDKNGVEIELLHKPPLHPTDLPPKPNQLSK